MTDSDLLRRREAAMDSADRALDAAWPARLGSDFVTAMTAAAAELEQVGDAMIRSKTAPVELSRTLRYRGSVLSDLAPALGKEMLEAAREAYRAAEELLEEHDDPVERAKLDFNLANTLRLLDANDVEQLSEAERRLLSARSVFKGAAPQYLQRVDEALESTRALLAAAPVAAAIDRGIDEMTELEEQLGAGDDPSEIARQVRELMDRDGGQAAMLEQIRGLINILPESAKADPRYDEVIRMFGQASDLAAHGSSAPGAAEAAILAALRDKVREQATAGVLSGGRQDRLDDVLDNLGKVLGGNSDDIEGLTRTVERIRGAAGSLLESNHYLSHGIERPAEGSRAAELVELSWALRRTLLEEGIKRGKTDSESRAVIDLSTRAAKLDRRIHEAGHDDSRATEIEREGLRQLALEIREFSSRHHNLVATPLWPGGNANVDVNAIVFSGSSGMRDCVAESCATLRFDLLDRPSGNDFAAARWRQLQTAAVAVFDFADTDGPDRAAVAYELGMARTLGKRAVVLATAGRPVEFDVDVPPTLLAGNDEDVSTIATALDEAVVQTMPRTGADPVDTVHDLLDRYPLPNADTYINQTLETLARLAAADGPLDTRPDPIGIRDALKTFVTYLDDPHVTLLSPAWPPRYGDRRSRRLFHVMPYRPDWADAAAQTAERVCHANNVEYVRGDRVPDADVIRSIWDEINLASHVLVDLTGFSANVALELGISHALGRNTLTIGQAGTVDRLFQNVARLRFHPYEDASGADLAASIERFIGSNGR